MSEVDGVSQFPALPTMADDELRASWAKTERLIRLAIAAFRRHGGDEEAIGVVVGFLEYNELGLAADQLADAAQDVRATDLWVALVEAALEMGLKDEAAEWIRRVDRYPCPCCGHLVFVEPPGSYDICPVCFWEDDPVQLRWPTFRGGANRPSLVEAQKATVTEGAMEYRFTGLVRGAGPDDPVEPGWRPADPAVDRLEDWSGVPAPWPDDLTSLYYWRH